MYANNDVTIDTVALTCQVLDQMNTYDTGLYKHALF